MEMESYSGLKGVSSSNNCYSLDECLLITRSMPTMIELELIVSKALSYDFDYIIADIVTRRWNSLVRIVIF